MKLTGVRLYWRVAADDLPNHAQTDRSKALRGIEIMRPIWEASGAVFPSIYLGDATNSSAFVSFTTRMAVAAADMVAAHGAKRLPVYPFASECYHNGTTLLGRDDLVTDIATP